MDYVMVAERVTAKVAGRGKEYREYFDKKLKKWNVKSPAEIPDDKKDDFFEEVDKGWNSADEKGDDGKKASGLMSLRDRKAGCEKLPAGPMRDNCEKKKEDGDKEDDSKEKKAEDAGEYATMIFGKRAVAFTIKNDAGKTTSGSQPYGKNPVKGIRYVLDLIEKWGIKPENVEVIK